MGQVLSSGSTPGSAPGSSIGGGGGSGAAGAAAGRAGSNAGRDASGGQPDQDQRGQQQQQQQYRWPPRSGSSSFFAGHFIMGGEKFESPQPESFLFGDNSDLNYLGAKPLPFPYDPPAPNEPTKVLRSLVHIRRDSLHFVAVPTENRGQGPASEEPVPEGPSEGPELEDSVEEEDDNDGEAESLGENPAEAGPDSRRRARGSSSRRSRASGGRRRSSSEASSSVPPPGSSAAGEKVGRRSRKQQPKDPKDELHRRGREGRRYRIEFTFDADVKCAITVSYFCTEEVTPKAAVYASKRPELTSSTYFYDRGAGQVFSQPDHAFQPGLYPECSFQLSESPVVFPVVIHCVALDGDAAAAGVVVRQSHTTIGVVDVTSDGTGFILKPLKQKLFVDGLSYLLQEVYGLENKNSDDDDDEDESGGDEAGGGDNDDDVDDAANETVPAPAAPGFYYYGNDDDDDLGDSGADCVVCMCEPRDTIILPCRHLCLCFACAESLRFQANNCPICRAPFRALLQIRAVQRVSHPAHPALAGSEQLHQDGVPPGYVAVSLGEALNGPLSSSGGRRSYLQPQPQPRPPTLTTTSGSSALPLTLKAAPSETTRPQQMTDHDDAGETPEAGVVDEVRQEGPRPAAGHDCCCPSLAKETTLRPSISSLKSEPSRSPSELQSGSAGTPRTAGQSDPTDPLQAAAAAVEDDDEDDDIEDEAAASSGELQRHHHRHQGHPGTPLSCSSARSSQDSACSTQQLLPKGLPVPATVPALVGASSLSHDEEGLVAGSHGEALLPHGGGAYPARESNTTIVHVIPSTPLSDEDVPFAQDP